MTSPGEGAHQSAQPQAPARVASLVLLGATVVTSGVFRTDVPSEFTTTLLLGATVGFFFGLLVSTLSLPSSVAQSEFNAKGGVLEKDAPASATATDAVRSRGETVEFDELRLRISELERVMQQAPHSQRAGTVHRMKERILATVIAQHRLTFFVFCQVERSLAYLIKGVGEQRGRDILVPPLGSDHPALPADGVMPAQATSPVSVSSGQRAPQTEELRHGVPEARERQDNPHYNGRMRERILFLWGEEGLQWFGISEEKYLPQLASSIDSEKCLTRHKNILNQAWLEQLVEEPEK